MTYLADDGAFEHKPRRNQWPAFAVPAMEQRLTYLSDCHLPAAPAPVPRALWRVLGFRACRAVVARMCTLMSCILELRRGPPALESRRAIIRLWHVDTYQSVSRIHGSAWRLGDGVVLHANDPVLEMHIAADVLIPLLSSGTPWRVLIEEEFRSLSPVLRERPEVALVGDTILRSQVVEFGASVRAPPPGLHRLFDTFYRRLILLAFHRRGAARAMQDNESVVEAAISRANFCRRFSGREAPISSPSP